VRLCLTMGAQRGREGKVFPLLREFRRGGGSMWYSCSYDSKMCNDKDCDSCYNRWECVHYTPDPDGAGFQEILPEDEEFRLVTKRELHEHFHLIDVYVKRLTKLGYPESEMKKLVNLIYVLYKGISRKYLEPIIKSIEEGRVYPLDLYDKLITSLVPEVRTWIQEKVEREELSTEEAAEIMECLNEDEVPEELLIDFLVEKKSASFTGEIRLVFSVEEEEKGEEERKESGEWTNLKKLIKSIITLRSGKEAYKRSEQAKHVINKLGKKHYYYYLNKAWELRKNLLHLEPEERLKQAKVALGI